MKTSIFDMTFTLPPMVEMVEVEKDMQQQMSCGDRNRPTVSCG